MNNLKTIFIATLLFISCLSARAQKFKISGTVTGLADGTWLYVRLASPDIKLDSTQVKDSKFMLTGKMEEAISRVYLHTAKYTNYVSFWVEENPLTISLKSGEFKKAIIQGSKTQEEEERRAVIKKPIVTTQDSLNKLIESEKNAEFKEKLIADYRAARNQEHEMDITYIKNNPQSIISANLLDIYSSTWGKEKITPLYENLTTAMQNTPYGKNVKNFILFNKSIKVGDQFADFEQMNANGKKIKLSAIKGKYILLEFWGSWCGPCREENPNLVKTYNAYKAKGFQIIGVAADDNKTQWLKAIKDDQLPWENVSDLKGDKNVVAVMYGVSAYPTNYLIDSNGKIIAKNLRGDALKTKLAQLLP